MGSILEVRNLTKRFGGLTAVAGLDFDLHEGEILGLIGPNGAGKTTTFNIIAGTYQADEGEIRFAGQPILGLPPHRIARLGIMRTFQHNRPFSGMPVLENVMVGAHTRFSANIFSRKASNEERAQRRRAEELVEFVGLAGLRDADVGTLSFGQGRLLEIARALAGEPRVILFDEPAAGLSPTERSELVEILTSLPAHIGYIVIEHDMDVALRVVESVTMMHNGRIFKEGPPGEIESDPEVQELYLGGGHHG